MGGRVHLPALEVGVCEVHILLILDHLHHFAETVDVELPDKGLKTPQLEEQFEDAFVYDVLGQFYGDLVGAVPTDILPILRLLTPPRATSRMW